MNQQRRALMLPFGKRARAIGLVTAAAVVLWAKPMGLLLWARLRILANIPRTAIADDASLPGYRFETPSLAGPEVVVLPRSASRNPFAEATESRPEEPRGPDSQRNPNLKRTIDRSDRADEAKSTGKSADENATDGQGARPRS